MLGVGMGVLFSAGVVAHGQEESQGQAGMHITHQSAALPSAPKATTNTIITLACLPASAGSPNEEMGLSPQHAKAFGAAPAQAAVDSLLKGACAAA